MNFLHYEFNLNEGDVIEVVLNKQANVRLLSDANFQAYRAGNEHRYHGGLAKTSPARLTAPSSGHWHVVVDLGGYPGTVEASVKVLSPHAA